MKEQIEWLFVLRYATGATDTSLQDAGNALISVAVQWAETHEFGIGGGYKIIPLGEHWYCEFNLGLTATRDGQMIKEIQAEYLLNLLFEYSIKRLHSLVGTYREFPVNQGE